MRQEGTLTSILTENTQDGIRAKQLIADKKKVAQNRGKRRKIVINLKKWKLQERIISS
jgi:hypothetical protein